MRRLVGTVGTGTVVLASAYDSMLHRNLRFWDVIVERMEENMRRWKATEEGTGMTGVVSHPNVRGGVHEVGDEVDLPFFGPTIGKRRDFVARSSGGGTTDDLTGKRGRGGGDTPLGAKSKVQREKISAFRIGEEFGLDAPPPL
ncbi:hypothetical protein ACHAXA_004913 [Cyclostephanos tholiformis]|uniref:Uncharacterized protein n=1 Tax=Cyclostephanos tholiformis TaxID=382380 RepID=A0ABD3RX55_9STRA